MCFISILFYISAPQTYSYEFCFFVFIAYIFFNVVYFLQDIKNRNLSFEFLFMISFLMTNFIYPVFYYLNNPAISLFAFSFNENVISKSTSLALLGYAFYILGNSNYKKNVRLKYNEIKISDHIVWIVFFLSLVNFIIFFSLGGLSFYKDIYSGGNAESGVSVYFMLFLSVTTYLLSVLIFNNNNRLLKIIILFYILGLIIVFLSTGARLFAMSLALLLLIQYSNFIKKIPVAVVSMLMFIGAFLLHVVQVYREIGVDNSSFSAVLVELFNGKSSVFDSFLDLIINNRNLYVLTDFVDSYGYVYFLNVSASVFGVFPGIKSLMNFFSIPDYMTSGTLPTFLEFGYNASFGLGTNMVGEAYLSLGVLGVVFVFFAFGVMINYFNNKAKINIYYRICFFFLASQAVFFPRIDYLWGTRLVVWMLVTYFLVKLFSKFLKSNH